MSELTVKGAAQDASEAEAIKQAKEGDAAAFERLYKKHCRHVYSLCLRMIKNPTEAEDLTQQTFLQVFRKIGTFRGDSGLSTWVHKVTVNVVLMHIRRKKPTEFLSRTWIATSPMASFPVNLVRRTNRCWARSIGSICCARCASYPPAIKDFSYCTT